MLRHIISTVCLVICFTMVVKSQLLTPFKASQGLSTAIGIVKDSGMTDPELVAVGTFTGTLPFGPIQIDLEYNMDNGTATAWGYFFRSAVNHDSVKAIGVIKSIIGYGGIEIPLESLPDIPATKPDSALPAVWMDSDIMVQNLKKNKDYDEFIKTYPDTKMRLLGLGVNNENPMIELNVPWWTGIYRSEYGFITCWVNSNSGESICLPVTTAEDNASEISDVIIYPNPATDILYVLIPIESFNISFRYELYDNLGNICTSGYENGNGEKSNMYAINASELQAGLYYIKLRSAGKIIMKPVVIYR